MDGDSFEILREGFNRLEARQGASEQATRASIHRIQDDLDRTFSSLRASHREAELAIARLQVQINSLVFATGAAIVATIGLIVNKVLG